MGVAAPAGTGLRVRAAELGDASDVAALLDALGYPCDRDEAIERIGHFRHDPRQHLLLAELDGAACGLADGAAVPLAGLASAPAAGRAEEPAEATAEPPPVTAAGLTEPVASAGEAPPAPVSVAAGAETSRSAGNAELSSTAEDDAALRTP